MHESYHKVIRLSHPTGILRGCISLEGSKSLSNRVLLIRALCRDSFSVHNLSVSDDTQVLKHLLEDPDRKHFDVGHAGTSFRFLTALLATRPGTQILTGSERMQERPIAALVDALRSINCKVEYLQKEGFPPLKIHSPGDFTNVRKLNVKAGISSQYITALMLIAPTLPNGLRIELEGELVSESYLRMSLDTMAKFGIDIDFEGNVIDIKSQDYKPVDFTIEADWSAASYYFAMVAMAKDAAIQLKGLFQQSVQGDSELVRICSKLGVSSRFDDGIWYLNRSKQAESFDYDFVNQPDIAQTLAVVCAAKGIPSRFKGLKTLKIKETDRIAALNNELSKIGSGFESEDGLDRADGYFTALPGIDFSRNIPRFASYNDHRMAMAFAPLALFRPIEIEDPGVVGKSYPGYWQDLKRLGFEIIPVQ